ncbi:hypothetical protein [Plantactinospora endophytica]|uniref:Uncharacterized protein n=1 Tax=Plantactinospora endophytica TaxID=673535 RepID=A0ABQ4E032_9ACTN|nr:hypothetical protein [Plantactinospora endophytica]GIG88088.1 hypothetical protein Pen02_30240 [Plantactinospora endophytica]
MLLPEAGLDWTETVLAPESRATKGVPEATPDEPLATRILLGGPVCRPLHADAVDDPGVAATLTTERDASDYTMVDLGVTFNPADGERIQNAWVQVMLSVPAGIEPAIAWSMTPERLASPDLLTTEIEVRTDLKILSLGAKTSRAVTRQDTFLQALNPLRADPTWEFSRTSSAEIVGALRMALMVRSAVGSPVRGALRMVAVIRRKRFKAIPYTVLAADGNHTPEAGAVMFDVR